MKTNLILAAIAVVLGLLTFWELRKDRQTFTAYDTIPRLFEGFTAENVRAIQIRQPKKKPEGDKKDEKPKDGEPAKPAEFDVLVMVKDDQTWKLADGELRGVPLVTSRIEVDILDHLKRIRIDRKALAKADADDAFLRERNLTDDTGTLIQCIDANNNPVAELILGKDASGGKWGEEVLKGYYVRKFDSKNPAGNKDVILYETDYWVLNTDPDPWLDKKIHQFEEGKVKSFAFRNPKGKAAFTKDKVTDAAWKAVDAPAGTGAVRQGEVQNLLSRFRYVAAQKFRGPLPAKPVLGERGLEPGDFEVSATLEDGTVYSLWIGKKIPETQEMYARANTSNFLFSVNEWDRTPYEKDPVEFFDPAPASQPATQPTETAPATQPNK